MAASDRRVSSGPPPPKGSHESWLFRVPPRPWTISGWALLPLRLFLGVTFAFAGLQKLSNPNFFDANSPASIQAQLIASVRVSPLHALLGHLLPYATAIGVLVAVGEVAVGIGMLVGLWTRIAAVGGALLAFTLFLTVSFHASPYYTGADLVFFVAFLPFILTGAGGAPSLDLWIVQRASLQAGAGDTTPSVIAFNRLQTVCLNYDGGACRAKGGQPCGPVGCPVLEKDRPSVAARVSQPDELDRRRVVIGAAAAAVVGVTGAVVAGGTAVMGRAVGDAAKATNATGTLSVGSSTTTTAPKAAAGSTSTTVPVPSGTVLGAAKSVPVGGAATFTAPNGDPGLVLQPAQGEFLAYDAICPHAGCTVGFSKAADVIVCPCHGSEFKVSNGDVIAGPAPHGLTPFEVTEGSDGQLYLKA